MSQDLLLGMSNRVDTAMAMTAATRTGWLRNSPYKKGVSGFYFMSS